MQRVGAHPADGGGARRLHPGTAPTVELVGVFTHLAVADDPTDPVHATQLARFDDALDAACRTAWRSTRRTRPGRWRTRGAAVVRPRRDRHLRHLAGPGRRRSLAALLRPALSLRARVVARKQARRAAGSPTDCGTSSSSDSMVATVPIGYADGVPRRSVVDDRPAGGEVLIGGRRRPILGVITMDQLMVDWRRPRGARRRRGGADRRAGRPDGVERITAEDWADQLDTIGYEIVCGISRRVPRGTRGP